jgi:hypothetical protein
MKLEFKNNFELQFEVDKKMVPVKLIQCFPENHPQKYLSVVDEDGKELAFIESLDQISSEMAQEVKCYLKYKNFRFEILKIEDVEDNFGLRNWKVVTKQGKRTFQMTVQDWPKLLKNNDVYFTDLAGDQYFLADYKKLDKISKRHLVSYIE